MCHKSEMTAPFKSDDNEQLLLLLADALLHNCSNSFVTMFSTLLIILKIFIIDVFHILLSIEAFKAVEICFMWDF